MTTTTMDTTAAEVLEQLEGRTLAPSEPKAVARGGTVQAERRPETAAVSAVEFSDDIGELFAALAEAQGEFGPIERTLTARIKSKREGGADYSYSYAPLSEVLGAVRPALSKHGLAVMQFPLTRQGSVLVRTLLGHKSGAWMRNDLAVGCVSTDPKDIGSAITYARRYAAQAILGIAPDVDDDGARGSGERAEIRPRAEADARVPIATVREMKRGDATVYAIRAGEADVWTDDPALAATAKTAMAAGTPVAITTETRKSARGSFAWIVEIRA